MGNILEWNETQKAMLSYVDILLVNWALLDLLAPHLHKKRTCVVYIIYSVLDVSYPHDMRGTGSTCTKPMFSWNHINYFLLGHLLLSCKSHLSTPSGALAPDTKIYMASDFERSSKLKATDREIKVNARTASINPPLQTAHLNRICFYSIIFYKRHSRNLLIFRECQCAILVLTGSIIWKHSNPKIKVYFTEYYLTWYALEWFRCLRLTIISETNCDWL